MEIDLVRFDINSAKILLKSESNPFNDEAYLNQSAYHAHQAIEKLLKLYLQLDYCIDIEQKNTKHITSRHFGHLSTA